MRILIVGGDVQARCQIEEFLRANGLETAAAGGHQSMQEHLAKERFDMVLLDTRFGSQDGLDLLRTVRTSGAIAVVILSGGRPEDETDRIIALELGADDYLPEPVGLRELLARIRAILRRRETRSELAPSGRIRFRGWELDRRLRILRDPASEIVKLTKSEYALLVAFLDSPGRPLSREYLLSATRVHEDIFDRSIDVQILRLRRKLERDPGAPRMIVTERGRGYLFDAGVEPIT